MRYHYVSSEPSGRIIEGDIEAANAGQILEWMAARGLRPVSIRALGGVEGGGIKRTITRAITLEDKIFITKYLALMLKVGTDLFKAIDILVADFDKPAVKALLIEVKDQLSKGQPFYSTFAKYPKYFSTVFVNLIKAGEASGNLDKVFEDLSKSLEKEQVLRSRVRSAMIYPIILVLLAFVILFLLVSFALPRLAEVFTSGGITPPLFSRVVFAVGLFMGKNVILISSLLVVGALGSWIFFSKTVIGRRIFNHLGARVPVVRRVVYMMAVQRFAATFASLLKSGMPIIEAIETTAGAVGSPELRGALLKISREGIAKGLTIGEAFQREPYFPRVVVNLIVVSEKAGHIEVILETLADFYAVEIDTSIKTLLSFLEPVLILIIGLIVGAIGLSIIIPIYQLVGNVSG